MSYVYVLNATVMEITLRVNDQDAGKVPKGQPSPATGFNLGKLNIERVAGMPEAPKFGSENTVEVLVDGQRTLFSAIKIDPKIYSLTRDLQLYLFYSAAVLTFEGQVIWVGLDRNSRGHPVPQPSLTGEAAIV